jgi:hypothetical protein
LLVQFQPCGLEKTGPQTEEMRCFPRKNEKRPAAVYGSGRNFAATFS